jgi:hypothetical protein
MGARKMAKGAILLSILLATNNVLSIESSLKGLIMLFKPPTSSTTPSPTLLHLKQSGMCLKKQYSLCYNNKNAPTQTGTLYKQS